MTQYFYDTEFIEDPITKTIDLVSIGIVASDGREYYAQSVEFDVAKADYWIRHNVLSHLTACSDIDKRWNMDQSLYSWDRCKKPDCPWRRREEIRDEIVAFMDPSKYGTPELWGYYSSYDHVVFCQLFGRMADLPNGYPYATFDLYQLCSIVKGKDFPLQEHVKQENEHNALDDARWNAAAWKYLMGIGSRR